MNYDFKNDIKKIRLCLDLSQDDFASEVELSRSNIARYESGRIEPRKEAIEKIYQYAYEHGFYLNQSKSMLYEDNSKGKMILFHGSKLEIDGKIDINHSLPPNDFGSGFYLGQSLEQAIMWVVANRHSSVYCFYFDSKNLQKLEFDLDYDWMLAILYYRGELEGYQLTEEVKNVIHKIETCDYIIAPIADNQMYDTLDQFKRGLISDVACLHALNANNLGKQFVLKTQKACERLEFVDRMYLCSAERKKHFNQKLEVSFEGASKAKLAIREYRKEGKMFDEIFQRLR